LLALEHAPGRRADGAVIEIGPLGIEQPVIEHRAAEGHDVILPPAHDGVRAICALVWTRATPSRSGVRRARLAQPLAGLGERVAVPIEAAPIVDGPKYTRPNLYVPAARPVSSTRSFLVRWCDDAEAVHPAVSDTVSRDPAAVPLHTADQRVAHAPHVQAQPRAVPRPGDDRIDVRVPHARTALQRHRAAPNRCARRHDLHRPQLE